MNLKHIKTQFQFTDGADEYNVVCHAAKRGDNTFYFFKNGKQVGSRTPNGGHVNKTSAKAQLMLFLKMAA